MSNPLITVIVPVYKVEPYLDHCIQSIVEQTYQNLEIILVDDGSPDNCPSMCDAWAKNDSRIKVIHKENGGLSDARNAGMAIASGELIGFVDSDDWISPQMYQNLYDEMIRTDSDIAACGVQMVWEDGTPSRMLTKSGCCILNTEDAMRAIIEETWLKQPVVYKLYRRDTIQDIPFPAGKYHEDDFWTYQAVGNAKRISVKDTPGYFYLQRSGSIMGEKFSLKRLDSMEAYFGELQYIQSNFKKIESRAITIFLFRLLYMYQYTLKIKDRDELQQCRNKLYNYYIYWKRYKALGSPDSLKDKIWYEMSNISIIATARIRNFLNVGF